MNRLSIIICTCNRSQSVSKLIDCFEESVVIPDDFSIEIIIVDNNSKDDTEKVIKNRQRKIRPFQLRYVLESKPGLSSARNRGISESQFEKICFLDDDVLCDPDFLKALNAAFLTHQDVACFAPRILFKPLNKPDWYAHGGKYAMFFQGNYDLGERSRFITAHDKVPIGAGMIFSREIFRRFGNFDPRFGYDISRSIMIPGEESELFFKIKSQKIPIFYVHDAVIHHYPEKEKYDIDTLCKTYKGAGYWYGTADARNLRNKNIIIWAGYPRSYYKRLIITGFNFVFSRFSSNKTIKYYHRFEWERTKGYFMGYSDFRKSKGV